MGRPESRRFTRTAAPEQPQGEIRPLRPGEPPAPAPAPAPTGKTTRKIPRTTRRAAAADAGEGGAVAAQASTEAKSQNQMLLIGGVGGGILLLLIVIAVAASSGSSGRGGSEAAATRPKKKAVEPPPPPPREPPRQYNYVRNTGSIVFVCGGTDKHQDREVVLSACLKCKTKNEFAHEAEIGYRCSSCKTVYENAAIKCDQCDRAPRVTHLKKVAAYQQK